jgi:mannose-1-phosphate guanylyltransferase
MSNPVRHSNRLWSVILAGGEGERARPMVQAWLGRHKPKQYCTFIGTRSMFQHTLDRAIRLTDPERIVAVIARGHWQEASAQLEGRRVGTVLLQPQNRNTAAGIFLPLTYIRAQDASATIVIYPSDHFVYPEDRFLDVVQSAVCTTEWLPNRLVLLGVAPDRLELEYGWIQPGEQLARSVRGNQVQAVRTFLEKPSVAQANAALAAGALWNMLVLAAKVDTLWQLGWRCFPEMMPLFEYLGRAIGTTEEGRVLEAIYREMPVRNFSSDLLQRVPEQVAVIELSQVLWSDWGKPERIVETLRRIGRQPAFPLACLTNPLTLIPSVAVGRR